MFAGAKDLGARVLLPVYHRLPAADEFDSLEFLRVEVAADDGLAQAVCEEAFVAKTCPTPIRTPSACLLFSSPPRSSSSLQVPDADLLLKLWRYEGCDVAELTRRLKKLAEADANGEDLERLEPTHSTLVSKCLSLVTLATSPPRRSALQRRLLDHLPRAREHLRRARQGRSPPPPMPCGCGRISPTRRSSSKKT